MDVLMYALLGISLGAYFAGNSAAASVQGQCVSRASNSRAPVWRHRT